MSVSKRKYRNGRVVWRYQFDAPGSTRENRVIIEQAGFATRKDAIEAEAARRIQIQVEHASAGVASSVRTTQEIYAHMITGQDEEAAQKWDRHRQRHHQTQNSVQ